jgi:peroxiredoxin 5
MLADANAEFTKAVELDMNIAPLGGVRSKRYSMVVENGTIESINVEPDGTGLTCSLAENIELK